jgi:glycogen debranching enzyme
MFHQPAGSLTHPYITPGGGYSTTLWDWDSWLCDIALAQVARDQGTDLTTSDAFQYGKGCVLDFLSFISPDGNIPISVRASSEMKNYLPSDDKTNMHKPVLAQHAAFLTQLNHGKAEWLRDQFPKLQAFLQNYRANSWDPATGLYFWQDDVATGIDNDPAVFYRPPRSSGNIYLNCLMYKELRAMAYLSNCLKMSQATIKNYSKQADDLKAAIQKNCWDERDGFFYSVDLNLLPVHREMTHYRGTAFAIHSGHPRDYDCLIQRIEVWSGFMAMWAGIATPEQAKRMVKEHLDNPKTFGGTYGVRSLSKMEKMYDIHFSGNPSNWQGPLWIITNYMVFKGLVQYGYQPEAERLVDKTSELLGKDYLKTGVLHESYDPDTGAPLGGTFQSWNYLVLNMIAWRDRRPVIQEF